MTKMALLMLWIVGSFLTLKSGQGLDVDEEEQDQVLVADEGEQEFLRAVIQGYDTNTTFAENFFELLGAICPSSVYCSSNDTSGTEAILYGDIDHEADANFTENLRWNFDHEAVNEARAYLRNNSHKLQGCCVPCSCEEDCVERQNCCPVKGRPDGNVATNRRVTQECVYAGIKSYLPRDPISVVVTRENSYFMVVDCFADTANKSVVTKCTNPDVHQPEETRPVYSSVTQRIYNNLFCAKCNGECDVVPMTTVVTFEKIGSFTGKQTVPSTPDSMYTMAISDPTRADITFTLPANIQHDTKKLECLYSIGTYSASRLCTHNHHFDYNQRYFFSRACGMQQIGYHTAIMFRNVFCFLCKRTIYSTRTTQPCDLPPVKTAFESFSALLHNDSFLSSTAAIDTAMSNPQCECSEFFDIKKRICRPVLCRPGDIRRACSCVPFITNITGLRIQLFLEIRPHLSDKVAQERLEGLPEKDVSKQIRNAVKRRIASTFRQFESKFPFLFHLNSTMENNSIIFYYVQRLTLNASSDDRREIRHMFQVLQRGIPVTADGTKMGVSLGRRLDITGHESAFTTNGEDITLTLLYPNRSNEFLDTRYTQPLNKLLYCPRVKLEEDEAALLNNATAEMGLSQTDLSFVYWKEDGSMCREDFETVFGSSGSNAALVVYSEMGEGLILSISVLSLLTIYIYDSL